MEKRVSSLSQGQRILAAIMITDAVGFSKRMSVDEGLTLKLIDRDLTLIAETCSDYSGTVLKSTGDGLLIYFVSAVEAVSCGLAIQQKLVDLADAAAPNEYLDHRIGIHLGDILVSEQDVMGNGVNITARLQTFAKPQGLCVSQTIFDVVKARLNLHSVFLGPLQLKNIEEPVPAYQISLTPDEDGLDPNPSMADEPTCTLPMATDVLLDIAVRTLITHSYSRRIKKLVFAAYQQAWENNTRVLDQFDLRSLLTSLRDRYPHLNELDYQFQRIVMGLNRQSLYADVAAIILETLQPWYARSIVSHGQTTDAPPPSLDQQYHQVAEILRQHEADELRFRKLLFCLCHHHWENDSAALMQINLVDLIQQSLQVAPHRRDLRYHLGRIVKRVNRRKTYTRVANDLMAAFQVLYNQKEAGAEPSGESSSDSGQISNGRSGDASPVPIEETRLSSPPMMEDDSGPNQTTDTCLGQPMSQEGYEDLTTLHDSLSTPIHTQEPGRISGDGSHAPRSRSSLFDLRLDIVQYANPLRAKILLYSCLHGPFSYTNQDWYTLRQKTLNELLHQTFRYCPTFSDLDSKLTIIAHCLDPHDENAQIAGTIALAMKPYYPKDPDALLEPAEAEVEPWSESLEANPDTPYPPAESKAESARPASKPARMTPPMPIKSALSPT
jgi:adenylate cyclase